MSAPSSSASASASASATASTGGGETWYKVCDVGQPTEGKRLHQVVEGRYVTLFRVRGVVSAIDAICHHAGGPLTLGPLQDIEDLGGVTVVSCPWHKFLVSVTDGTKVYQQVDIENGVPKVKGWKVGKVVQRAHKVVENASGVFVALVITDEPCQSDRDACSARCAQDYPMHGQPASLLGAGNWI